MTSWSDTLSQLAEAKSPIDEARKNAIDKLSSFRNRNLICYYSGWLQNPSVEEASITDNDMNGFMNAVCGMDRSKGLDLVLHTPGGDLAATESIVKYFKDCFGNDICAIVPHMAMSAGTMIACSCSKIIMGRESSLGPTDPQMGGVAAGAVIEEFEQAIEDVTDNPSSAALWGQIIGKYHPTFLGECQKVVEMSQKMMEEWLTANMFSQVARPKSKVKKAVDFLCDHSTSVMHNRHFSHTDLEKVGLEIELMEDNDELQDAILTLHHLYMITFQRAQVVKLIESNQDSSWIISSS